MAAISETSNVPRSTVPGRLVEVEVSPCGTPVDRFGGPAFRGRRAKRRARFPEAPLKAASCALDRSARVPRATEPVTRAGLQTNARRGRITTWFQLKVESLALEARLIPYETHANNRYPGNNNQLRDTGFHPPIARDQQNMGRGRGGRGRGGFDGGFGGPPGGPGMGRGGRRGGGDDMHEVQYTVPANKCGLVIGKGGEAIRQINQQSGAHVELSRAPPPNPVEKVFIIRGNPQQIEHAQQLINERIGGPPPGASNGQGPPNYPTQYPQPYQQPPPPNQPYAPQGWGNAYQHWQNQSAPPNDPSKAAADANAAAWAAYYAQYYGQQGGQPPQQPQPQPQPPQGGAPAQAMPNQAPQQQAPQAGAPAGAQPDYSQAWIEYYRSLGMFREAEMIEHQTRGNQSQQGQQPFPQGGGAGGPAPGQPAPGGPAPTGPPGGGAPGVPPGNAYPAAGGYPPQQQQPPQQQAPQQQPPQQPYGAPGGQYAGYNYAGYAGAQ
ncbi:far upstream element-binding protein 1 [Ixodes scapularis]